MSVFKYSANIKTGLEYVEYRFHTPHGVFYAVKLDNSEHWQIQFFSTNSLSEQKIDRILDVLMAESSNSQDTQIY